MRDRDEDVIMSSNVEDFNNIALSQLPESCQNKPSQTRKKKKRKNKKASLVQQPPKSKSASKVSKSRKRRLARRAMGLTLQQKMAAPQIGESLPTGWTASSIAGGLEEPSKPRQEFRDRCMRTIVPPKDSAKESPSTGNQLKLAGIALRETLRVRKVLRHATARRWKDHGPRLNHEAKMDAITKELEKAF